MSNAPVYRCKIFDIYETDVPLPDGRMVRQTRIDHKPTVAVVPVDDSGRIILLKQFRSALDQYLIEIPAGGMNPGEQIEACVQRELAEEAGYQAKTLIKLFEGYLVPGYCNEYMYFYLALDLVEKSLPGDEDEIIEIQPTSVADALRMIQSGEIIDAKTALGIILAERHLVNSGSRRSDE